MTLGWVIAGTIGQVLLAYMAFLMSVFGLSAVANNNRLTPFASSLLDTAFYALPASCLLSAVVVIGLYRAGSGTMGYLWYTAPVLLALAYVLYIKLFILAR